MATEITLKKHWAELAMHFRAKASVETGGLKAEYEHLAECYEQAPWDHDNAERSRTSTAPA